jgi:hypothetical protein
MCTESTVPTNRILYFETKDGSILKLTLTPNSLIAATIMHSASGEILRTPDLILAANLPRDERKAR